MGRPMVLALKGEELVNRRDRYGVGGMNSKRTTMGHGIRDVTDPGLARRHGRCPGDRAIMHEAGDGEVPPPKGCADLRHVSPDLSHPGWIITIADQGDAPAVRQRLEAVTRSVLVHAHGHVTTALHLGEGAIVG
jgi:hypothetical protein